MSIVNPRSLAFRMKVGWFEDILRHPPARRFIWSLYFAGEAYEELHPDGIFVANLPEGGLLRRQLARHLSDETRHAAIFRGLLAAEGLAPERLRPHEDIGWHLLTHIVPEAVEQAGTGGVFDEALTIRYMAFLHMLELRSIGDLCALIEAARSIGEPALAATLETILPDERFHATYTHRAVRALAASPRRARQALDRTRRAERKHLRESIVRILSRFEDLGTVPRTRAGRLRWWTMKQMLRLGLALPLLPIYDEVPRQLTPAPGRRAA
jgi:hypothetical protein